MPSERFSTPQLSQPPSNNDLLAIPLTYADGASLLLKSLDLEYHNLHQEKGLYFGLVDEGKVPRVTTDKAVELAQTQPPRNTRAFGRGELVRHLLEHGVPEAEEEQDDDQRETRFFPDYVINWSISQIRSRQPFPMPDLFKTYAQEVRSHLSG